MTTPSSKEMTAKERVLAVYPKATHDGAFGIWSFTEKGCIGQGFPESAAWDDAARKLPTPPDMSAPAEEAAEMEPEVGNVWSAPNGETYCLIQFLGTPGRFLVKSTKDWTQGTATIDERWTLLSPQTAPEPAVAPEPIVPEGGRLLLPEQIHAARELFYENSAGCNPRKEVIDRLAAILQYRPSVPPEKAESAAMVSVEAVAKIICSMCRDGIELTRTPGGFFHEAKEGQVYGSWPFRCAAEKIRLIPGAESADPRDEVIRELVETLQKFPLYPNPNPEGNCAHGEDWDLCDTCRWEWGQALADWISIRNAALTKVEALKEQSNG